MPFLEIATASVGGQSIRKLLENWVQICTVALTFLIASQYWQIREHVVFLLLFVYASATFFLSGRLIRLDVSRVLIGLLFAAFLFWLLASASWSPTPHMSIAYGLLSLLTGFSAVFQGLVISVNNFVWGLVWGVGFQVTHSIFLFLTRSDIDSEHLAGLYTNRSTLTLVIGVALVTLPFAAKRTLVSWLVFGSIFTFLFLYLMRLNILTSFFAVSGALAVGLALIHLRRQSLRSKKLLSWLYVSAALGGASIFWFFRGPLLGLIGEDANMSERVPLWGLYFEAVLWRPILGSGWGSTVGWDFPLSRDRLSPVAEWFPAHNGYLDIALMLGLVGLGLFLGALAMLLFVTLRHSTDAEVDVRFVVAPVVLVYLILNDIAATSFPKFLGLYLVGTLVGFAIAKSPSLSDNSDARSVNVGP